MLREISGLVLKRLRTSDVLARLGGEEFAIILPETCATGAKQVAEQLRQQIAAQQFHHDVSSFSCSVSFGVAEFQQADNSHDQVLKRADEALYQAKNCGRDQVRVHAPQSAAP